MRTIQVIENKHTTRTQKAFPKRGILRTLYAAAIGGLAFVLAACGAVIDTVLTVNTDGSGVRTMTATLAADDLEEYVTGGVAEIEAAIAENLPEGLEYGGVSEGEEGASVFTFTIPFEDAQEYEQKVITILGAGGVVDQEAAPEIVVADNVFRQGVSVDENFTSQDLMQWLTESMISRGTVPSDQRSNVSEIGETAVRWNDVSYDTNSRISFEEIRDFGVTELVITTAGLAGTEYERTIEFTLPREAYAANGDAFNEYFASIVPEGGELAVPSSTEATWTLTLPVTDATGIIAMTNAALSTENTDFAVNQSLSESSPGEMITDVIDVVDCSAICAEESTVSVQAVTPLGWESGGGASMLSETDTNRVWSFPNSTETQVRFTHRAPFIDVHTTLNVPFSGEATAQTDFVLAEEFVETFGPGITQLLTPTSTYGQLETLDGDGQTTYRVTLTGADSAALSSALSEYLPNSWIGSYQITDEPFSYSYGLDAELRIPQEWISGGVENGVTYEVVLDGSIANTSLLPSGTTVDGGSASYTSLTGESVAMTVQSGGAKIAPIVILIVVIVLVLAAAASLLLLFRKRRAKAGSSTTSSVPPAATPVAAPVTDPNSIANNVTEPIDPTVRAAPEQPTTEYPRVPREDVVRPGESDPAVDEHSSEADSGAEASGETSAPDDASPSQPEHP